MLVRGRHRVLHLQWPIIGVIDRPEGADNRHPGAELETFDFLGIGVLRAKSSTERFSRRPIGPSGSSIRPYAPPAIRSRLCGGAGRTSGG